MLFVNDFTWTGQVNINAVVPGHIMILAAILAVSTYNLMDYVPNIAGEL